MCYKAPTETDNEDITLRDRELRSMGNLLDDLERRIGELEKRVAELEGA